MRFSFLSHLECSRCAERYDAASVQGLCRCGSPLLARYDLDGLRGASPREAFAARELSLWRYHELLPVGSPEAVVTLGEGMTPLVETPRLGNELGVEGLLVKDDGTLPSASFKTRGAAVGVSRAKELGVHKLAMPSNGNAAAAWAMYAARAGLELLVVMPEDAPSIARAECAITGADLYLVDGLINDAGRIVKEAVEQGDWMDVATLKEPYRLEGKKTLGLEIAEQLSWTLPDVVVYPTGGGVGLLGIHKAFTELLEMGWVSGPMPRFVAVQASGCAPIVKAFEHGEVVSTLWDNARTVAFGITVPKALGDFMILDVLYKTDGTAVAVDDAEILDAEQLCARSEGMFICPEGAATLVAVKQLRASGWLGANERVVAINTGAGIKYPDTVQVDAPIIPADGAIPTDAR